jgi:hypothetical protein
MDSAKLNDWMQVVGIFAVVLSLIFVGLQMRQEQEIAIMDTYGSVAEAQMDLSVRAGENMSVWKKGLEHEELTEDERGVFDGLAAAVWSHYQRNFIRWARLGPGNPDFVASDMAYALYVFPGLREFFEANQKFNSSRDAARGTGNELIPWTSSVLRHLEKYDEEAAPIPDTKEYIFWTF